jgi:hypothetical protein
MRINKSIDSEIFNNYVEILKSFSEKRNLSKTAGINPLIGKTPTKALEYLTGITKGSEELKAGILNLFEGQPFSATRTSNNTTGTNFSKFIYKLKGIDLDPSRGASVIEDFLKDALKTSGAPVESYDEILRILTSNDPRAELQKLRGSATPAVTSEAPAVKPPEAEGPSVKPSEAKKPLDTETGKPVDIAGLSEKAYYRQMYKSPGAATFGVATFYDDMLSKKKSSDSNISSLAENAAKNFLGLTADGKPVEFEQLKKELISIIKANADEKELLNLFNRYSTSIPADGKPLASAGMLKVEPPPVTEEASKAKDLGRLTENMLQTENEFVEGLTDDISGLMEGFRKELENNKNPSKEILISSVQEEIKNWMETIGGQRSNPGKQGKIFNEIQALIQSPNFLKIDFTESVKNIIRNIQFNEANRAQVLISEPIVKVVKKKKVDIKDPQILQLSRGLSSPKAESEIREQLSKYLGREITDAEIEELKKTIIVDGPKPGGKPGIASRQVSEESRAMFFYKLNEIKMRQVEAANQNFKRTADEVKNQIILTPINVSSDGKNADQVVNALAITVQDGARKTEESLNQLVLVSKGSSPTSGGPTVTTGPGSSPTSGGPSVTTGPGPSVGAPGGPTVTTGPGVSTTPGGPSVTTGPGTPSVPGGPTVTTVPGTPSVPGGPSVTTGPGPSSIPGSPTVTTSVTPATISDIDVDDLTDEVVDTIDDNLSEILERISRQLSGMEDSLRRINVDRVDVNSVSLSNLNSAIDRISRIADDASRTIRSGDLSSAARTVRQSYSSLLKILGMLGVGVAGYALYTYGPSLFSGRGSSDGAGRSDTGGTGAGGTGAGGPGDKDKENIPAAKGESTDVDDVPPEVIAQRGKGAQVIELDPPVTLLGTTFTYVISKSPERRNPGSVRLVRDELNQINGIIESQRGPRYRINPVVILMERKFPGIDLAQLYEKFRSLSSNDKIIYFSEIFDLMLNKDLATAGGQARTRKIQRMGPESVPGYGRIRPRERRMNLNPNRVASLDYGFDNDNFSARKNRLLKLAASIGAFGDIVSNFFNKITPTSLHREQAQQVAKVIGEPSASAAARLRIDKWDAAISSDSVKKLLTNGESDIRVIYNSISDGLMLKDISDVGDIKRLIQPRLKPEYRGNINEITDAWVSSDPRALDKLADRLTASAAPTGAAPASRTTSTSVTPEASPAASRSRGVTTPAPAAASSRRLTEEVSEALGGGKQLDAAGRAEREALLNKKLLESEQSKRELSKLRFSSNIPKYVLIAGATVGVAALSYQLMGMDVLSGIREMFGDSATDEEITNAAKGVSEYRISESVKLASSGKIDEAFDLVDSLVGDEKQRALNSLKNYFGKRYSIELVPPAVIFGTEFRYAFLDSAFSRDPAAVRWALYTLGNKGNIKSLLYIIAADSPGYLDIYSRFETATGVEKQKYFNTLLDLILEFGMNLPGGMRDVQKLISGKQPIRREKVTPLERGRMKKEIRQQSRFAKIKETLESIHKTANVSNNSTNNSLQNELESLFKNADDFSRSYYKDAITDLNVQDPELRSYFTRLKGMYDEKPEAPKEDYKDLYPMEGETGAELYESAYPREARTSKSIGDGGLVENGFERKKKMEDIARSVPTGNYSAKYAWVQDIMSKKSKK